MCPSAYCVRLLRRPVFLDEICKVFILNCFELFARFFDILESLHHSFRHSFVRLLRAADDGKLLSLCDSLVPILVVETDSE